MTVQPHAQASAPAHRAEPAPTSFDHVALWVAQRDALAEFTCRHLGMHVIDRTEAFTLVGVDALLGKLTLFDAEGPRAPGALGRVALRVANVEAVLAGLPDDVQVQAGADGVREVLAPEDLRIGLVAAQEGQVSFDLDHVVLRVGDPIAAGRRLAGMGFVAHHQGLWVGDRHLRLVQGPGAGDQRPLLNHLALLVGSVQDYLATDEGRELEVDEYKDAANTLAAFVPGPSGIRVEYVEHKPGFSLV